MEPNCHYIVDKLSRITNYSKTDSSNEQRHITVTLQQVIPVLVDASNRNVAWINDFEEEQISISKDLYDVIQAACSLQST